MGQYIPAPIGDASPGVAPGGLKGQYLRKASDLDYDTDWEDVVATGGGGGGSGDLSIDGGSAVTVFTPGSFTLIDGGDVNG